MFMIQQSKKTLTLKTKAGTVMLCTTGRCLCTDTVSRPEDRVFTRYIMDWFDLEVKKKNTAVLTLDAVTLIHETK